MKHPAFRYYGGKWRLASWIISHMPEHRIYVEPFGGAASVLLRKPRVYSEVYNDLDQDVVNFFRVVRDETMREKLYDMCFFTPYSRDEFKLAQEDSEDPIIKAQRFVVRCNMGFSGFVRKRVSGFSADSRRKSNTPAHLWAKYPELFMDIAERFRGVLIENKPAVQIIQSHDSEDAVIYIDPPYVPGTRTKKHNGYTHEMTEQDHEELLNVANKVKGCVLISGYDNELYNDLLSGWDKKTTSSRIGSNKGTKLRTEVLWVNRRS